MTKESLQLGWDWTKVSDLSYWKIPDGFVLNLPYFIGQPPANILDLGCGVGRHTVYFATLGYTVSAIDISKEAVSQTKKWLNEEKLSADVKEGKMTSLDFPSENFDLVLAFNVIYHAYRHDVVKTVNEIFRVLKPGGYFYGTILTKDPKQPFYNSEGVIDEQTLIKSEEPEKGVPHFFSYIEDVLEFFTNFELEDLFYKEWYSAPYTIENIADKKGNGHYIIRARKPK